MATSANVKAAYAQRANAAPPEKSKGALRRNARRKRLEAYGTIHKDSRAPAVVQKADADLKQQKQEMGDDQPNDAQQVSAAGQAPDPVGAEGAGAGVAGPDDAPAAQEPSVSMTAPDGGDSKTYFERQRAVMGSDAEPSNE